MASNRRANLARNLREDEGAPRPSKRSPLSRCDRIPDYSIDCRGLKPGRTCTGSTGSEASYVAADELTSRDGASSSSRLTCSSFTFQPLLLPLPLPRRVAIGSVEVQARANHADKEQRSIASFVASSQSSRPNSHSSTHRTSVDDQDVSDAPKTQSRRLGKQVTRLSGSSSPSCSLNNTFTQHLSLRSTCAPTSSPPHLRPLLSLRPTLRVSHVLRLSSLPPFRVSVERVG